MFFLIKHRFGAKELTLPVNYRSDEVILEAANRFLQFGGKIEGSGERGEKILVRNHYDPFIEAEYLTERIRELHEKGLPYREIAVFYRVQKQAEILEKVFERAELPYVLPAKQKEDENPVPERPHMIREYVAEGKLNAVSGEHTMEKVADTERQMEEEDAVHLMTLHASKGLEFDYVFIIGMNQGLIPLRCKSIEQEEEERRLFFVGLTRARKNLELSYYTNPTIPGTYETPSNYLRMLPEELLDWEEKPGSESRKANLQKLRKDTRELIREKKQEEEEQKETRKPERKGRHPKYGEGEIISEDEMMIELEFPGYGKKQFLKAFGEVAELLPVDPGCVVPKLNSSWEPVYQVTFPDGSTDVLSQEDIWHVRTLTLDGLVGLNPVAYAREAISLAAATEEHGARLFSNGAVTSGVLRTEQTLSDQAYERLKKDFEERHTGLGNAHRPMILEMGLDWKSMALNAEDSQFLETRKFQLEEICRLFRVPLHMVQNTDRATFNNIEELGLGFINYSLVPYLTRIEQRINTGLVRKSKQGVYYAKFNAGALLRGDMKSRFEAYATGINWGIYSPNDCRDLEDMNPRPGGDVYLTPMNMTTKPSDGSKAGKQKDNANADETTS